MGAMRVPAAAYYGAQTAQAVENFPSPFSCAFLNQPCRT